MRRFLSSAPDLAGTSKKQRMEPDSAAPGSSAPVQCSQLTPTLLTTDDVNHAKDCKMDTWVSHNGMMYKLHSNANSVSTEMVAFDMDSTLIATKSGKTYAVDEHDWKLWDPSVRTVLQKLHSEGKYIAIISNQNGIKVKAVTKEAVQRKVDRIIESIGVPLDFICAIDDNHFRKPRTGMWEFLCYARRRDAAATCTNGAVPMIGTSLYVGDAAGRPQEGTRGKDHSDSDYKLALNMNVEFSTPEKYFLGSVARLHCQLPDPRSATGAPFRLIDVAVAPVRVSGEHYVPPERCRPSTGSTNTTAVRPAPAPRPQVDPFDSPERDDSGYEEALWAARNSGDAASNSVAGSSTAGPTEGTISISGTPSPAGDVAPTQTAPTAAPEILLLAAPPACGKSTLARRYEAAGYVRVNQDTIGSVDKCLAAARQALTSLGSSVCVDNTNMDPATRQKWVQLAKQCGVQIRAIALKTPREVSSLLSAYRLLDPTTLPGDRRKIERVVVNTYFKNPIYPALREGFNSVETLDLQLVPPTDPQALRLFYMYLK